MSEPALNRARKPSIGLHPLPSLGREVAPHDACAVLVEHAIKYGERGWHLGAGATHRARLDLLFRSYEQIKQELNVFPAVSLLCCLRELPSWA